LSTVSLSLAFALRSTPCNRLRASTARAVLSASASARAMPAERTKTSAALRSGFGRQWRTGICDDFAQATCGDKKRIGLTRASRLGLVSPSEPVFSFVGNFVETLSRTYVFSALQPGSPCPGGTTEPGCYALNM